VLWYLGGDKGSFDIHGIDGTIYAAGSTVWSGQHNAE
jgi:hypothetical protein